MTRLTELANDLLDQHEELGRLREENAYLRGFEIKYHELLNGSISHNEHMLGSLLQLVMVPGVSEAITANKEREPS